jgi:hypothetical protein
MPSRPASSRDVRNLRRTVIGTNGLKWIKSETALQSSPQPHEGLHRR